MGSRKRITLTLLWVLALAGSFLLDAPISQWLYERSFHVSAAGVMRNTPWANAFKLLGDFRTIVVLVLLLIAFARLHWRQASVLLICGAMSIFGEAVKFMVGRARPLTQERVLADPFEFAPFSIRDGGMSFPSGHALLAFATAMCLARYYPKWALVVYSVAAMVAAERVLELSHHLSDVVASCGLALLTTHWMIGRLEKRILAERLPAHEEEEIVA